MAATFEHVIEAVDERVVRFSSKEIHPDAGIAWDWHHSLLAIARIDPIEENPIATYFGDDLFDDRALEPRWREIFVDVAQVELGKGRWDTTVCFTDAKWIPKALVPGYRWQSAA